MPLRAALPTDAPLSALILPWPPFPRKPPGAHDGPGGPGWPGRAPAPFGRPAPPFLRQPPDGGTGSGGPDEPQLPKRAPAPREQSEGPDAEPLLYCVSCLAPITSERLRLSVAGSHRHVFANPHGLVFELGCFSGAPGCAGISPITTDFSWFAGTAWQAAVCAACNLHLGWRYDRAGGDSFFGLLLDRLRRHAPDSM